MDKLRSTGQIRLFQLLFPPDKQFILNMTSFDSIAFNGKNLIKIKCVVCAYLARLSKFEKSLPKHKKLSNLVYNYLKKILDYLLQ